MVDQRNVTRAAIAAAKKSKSSLSGQDANEIHRLLVPLPVVSKEGAAGDWSEVPSDPLSITQDDWESEPNNYKDTVPGDVPVESREDPLVFNDEEENTSGKEKQDAVEPDFIEFMKAVPDVGKTPIDLISALLEQALAAQVSGNIVMANVFLKAIRELDPKKQQNFGVASVEPEEETNDGATRQFPIQMSLPSQTRSTVHRLTTQQFRCRPASVFSCRQFPRWYSSRPDPSATGVNINHAEPVKQPVAASSSSQAPQENSLEETERPKPPPYLPRPLGVEDPPSTRPRTEEEKLAKLVDEQARLQERKHLLIMGFICFFFFFKYLRIDHLITRHIKSDHSFLYIHNGNKLWTAPPSLIQDQRALYFPNISGIALSNKETKHTTDIFTDKVSILAVESTRMSEEHTRSFYGEPLRMMAEESNLQLVRLNVQENPLKSWLVSLFINNLRKTVPTKQHSGYILTNQSLEYVREPLGMVNKLLGYVYLVDWNKKVRWAGCGFSNADEVSALFSGTRALLKRFEDNEK
ncbi:hypothetical protein PtA15_2A318 [Puccinia triticina]|uniref:Uncharacterized protein n=1 Tax=Puccinia triticina TaxID=208348 RepID=A0ABY7CB48_9BASI|nr:uncharacterized protein PtA15_2A318 [Puccinia triticina]WAQ82005.1 hypothetical protein PtA15_2A318 [Puccinia triticina]WAR52881.1 hypothetical protein PtB15_2B309 [Puccinia triticina]